MDLSSGKVIGQPEVVEGYLVLNVKCPDCKSVTMLFGLPGVFRACSNPECPVDLAITGMPAASPAGPVWSIGHRRRPKVV